MDMNLLRGNAEVLCACTRLVLMLWSIYRTAVASRKGVLEKELSKDKNCTSELK